MADSYVVSMARLQCSMGNQPSQLMVYPDRTVFMSGQPMANISDHIPMYNIMPFGLCRSLANPTVAAATAANLGRLQPMPCIPNTQVPWLNGKMDTLVQNQPALLKSCTCPCMWAGIISITDNGQHAEGTQYVQKSPKDNQSPTQFNRKELPEMTGNI